MKKWSVLTGLLIIAMLTPSLYAVNLDTAYISYGDNVHLNWLPVDSTAAIDTLFETLSQDWNIERIFWRGFENQYWSRNSFNRKDDVYGHIVRGEWWAALVENGTVGHAVSAAHAHGMEIWATTALFLFGGPADHVVYRYPGSWQDQATRLHPEWLPVNRFGTRRHAGPICFSYPEARQHLIDRFVDLLVEYGYDGIGFYTYGETFELRYDDEFGYNEPIVAEYKARYGVDILTEEFDTDKWAELRGEYVTAFLTELRAALEPHGIKLCVWLNPLDPDKPQYWGVHQPRVRTAGNIHMDWQRWVDDEIVDELFFYGYNADNFAMVNAYCAGTQTRVSASRGLFPNLPAGSNAAFQLQEHREIESGYTWADKPGTSSENLAPEPLSSLYGTDVYAKRRVLYRIERGLLSATVTDIVPALSDPDIYVRRGALRALTALNDPAAVIHLENALLDSENSVRCQAADSFKVIKGTHSALKMFQSIEHHYSFQFDIALVPHVMLSMRSAGTITAYELAALITAITNNNVYMRRSGLKSLQYMNPGNWTIFIDYLIDILFNDPDGYCRELAADVLAFYPGNASASQALRDAFVTGNHFTQTAVTVRQSMEVLRERFKEYGNLSTRIDREWGWRVVGNALATRHGQAGIDALKQIADQYEKTDALLAERAWLSAYIPMLPGQFSLTTPEADEIIHAFRPTFREGVTQTVFKDTFETEQSVAGTDPGIDALPVAQVGQWQITGTSALDQIQVRHDLIPGSFEGGKYLSLTMDEHTQMRGVYDDAATLGRKYALVYLDFNLYLPSENTGDVKITAFSAASAGQQEAYILSVSSDGKVRYNDGNGWIDTGLEMTQDQWHRLIVAADVYDETYTVSVYGQQSAPIALLNGHMQIDGVTLTRLGGNDVSFLIDDFKAYVSAVCTDWSIADFNADCRVDLLDFAMLAEQWLLSE